MTQQHTVDVLLNRYGQTYAEHAGIRLRDKPSPLYRLLVLSLLLSARISGDIAVRSARELSADGYRTPRRMAAATWQHRVDALGRGGYRRYDERTATMLGEGAQRLLETYHGDLRRLRKEADDAGEAHTALQRFPGIGPLGATIFCREVQGIWPELAPWIDDKALDGAGKIGLPTSVPHLARLVDTKALPRLTAACVRASLSQEVVRDVQEHG